MNKAIKIGLFVLDHNDVIWDGSKRGRVLEKREK
jgi:hypothetical protein